MKIGKDDPIYRVEFLTNYALVYHKLEFQINQFI